MTDATEPYHQMSIPEGALPAVTAALNEYYQRGRTATPSTSPATPAPRTATSDWDIPDNGTWQPADLQALERKLHNTQGRAILTEVMRATLEDRKATYGDLQAAAAATIDDGEFSLNQVRAQLSWIAKYCKAIKGEKVWPMQVQERDDDSLPRGERYLYNSTRQVAEMWMAIINEAGR